MFSRRSFLTHSAIAGSSFVLPQIVTNARAADDSIKVGIPVPISGAFAANGKFASMGAALAAEIVEAFLRAEISNEERHVRRRAKVLEIERTGGDERSQS